ncbi:MAG: hypothetical protein FJY20_00865 [Bacteroidetes bacterium]|nr:hypothetical protein [Bacteroidota bacterium]
MPRHEDKYISKLLFGFGAIIAAVMLLFFVGVERMQDNDDWYWWGMADAALFCTGIYFIASACIHKMKSDIVRKQKMRNIQKSSDVE